MNIPDNYEFFRRHDEEQEMELQKLPICCYCEEPVQSEVYFEINDEIVCPYCLDEHFKRRTDEYVQ